MQTVESEEEWQFVSLGEQVSADWVVLSRWTSWMF